MTELREMQRLVQDAWRKRGPLVEFHVGDLAWMSREPEARNRVWRADADPVAFAWISPPDELGYLVDDDALHDDVLEWFERESDDIRTVWALETDAAKTRALAERGYRRADGAFFVHLTRSLDDVPAAPVPHGYRLSHVGADDVPRRVAVQRAAFAGSTTTEEKYRRLLRTWPYRPELDVVVEAADGAYAAFCLGWLDDENAVVELEPVGTHPEHARRGLATGAILDALRHASDHGARTAVVYARGDEAYPAPLRLYRSLGFEPVAAQHRYALS